MRQPTPLQQHIQRFQGRVDHFKERLAKWLNKKAVAIPLRVVRFIFLLYVATSILVFSLILCYPGDFFTEPTRQVIRPTVTIPKQIRLAPPAKTHTATDSLPKLSNTIK